jgi:hypothetical protein
MAEAPARYCLIWPDIISSTEIYRLDHSRPGMSIDGSHGRGWSAGRVRGRIERHQHRLITRLLESWRGSRVERVAVGTYARSPLPVQCS